MTRSRRLKISSEVISSMPPIHPCLRKQRAAWIGCVQNTHPSTPFAINPELVGLIGTDWDWMGKRPPVCRLNQVAGGEKLRKSNITGHPEKNAITLTKKRHAAGRPKSPQEGHEVPIAPQAGTHPRNGAGGWHRSPDGRFRKPPRTVRFIANPQLRGWHTEVRTKGLPVPPPSIGFLKLSRLS
jgi:hypothetical protein